MSVAGLVVSTLHAVAATSLAPGKYTLSAGNAYNITQAGEYTLTTATTEADLVLYVDLGKDGKTIVLNLESFSMQLYKTSVVSGYIAPLTVVGNGKLVIRHVGTKPAQISVKDNSSVDKPAIDLSGMSGGEVRFERGDSLPSDALLEITRKWGVGSGVTNNTNMNASQSKAAIPVIKGSQRARIVFASGMKALVQAVVHANSQGTSKELPPILANGCKELVIGEDALVEINPYVSSASITNSGWTLSTLFENTPIVLAGGTLQAVTSNTSSYVNLSDKKLKEAVGQATGQGVIFGNWIYSTGLDEGEVVPAACLKASSALETPLRVDAQGRLLIDASLAPSVVYAEGSQPAAATIFGVTPEWTSSGCKVSVDFGIADLLVKRKEIGDDLEIILTVAVVLPKETADERTFYLRLLQTADSAVTTTLYPNDGSTAARTTFTREPGTTRFCASLTIPFPERTVGLSAYTVRAYVEPPAE